MNCFKSLRWVIIMSVNLLNRHVRGVNSVLLPVSVVLGGKDEKDIVASTLPWSSLPCRPCPSRWPSPGTYSSWLQHDQARWLGLESRTIWGKDDMSDWSGGAGVALSPHLGMGSPFISKARITSPAGSMALSKGKEQQYWFPTWPRINNNKDWTPKPTLYLVLIVGKKTNPQGFLRSVDLAETGRCLWG